MKFLTSFTILLISVSCAESTVNDLRSYNPGVEVKKEQNTSENVISETSPSPTEIIDLQFKSDTEKLSLIQNGKSVVNVEETSKKMLGGTVVFSLEEPREDLEIKINGRILDPKGMTLLYNAISNLKIEVKHLPMIGDNSISFSPAGDIESIEIIYKGESIEDKILEIPVELSKAAVISAKSPDSNGGKMIALQDISLPVGVGLCIVNEYKDGLTLHGVPHQPNGGMGMGACYDKYGGDNKSVSDLSEITVCSTGGSDTMYDHDVGNTEALRFNVSCETP